MTDRDRKRRFIYLVERKRDKQKFAMIGNMKNINLDTHKYLYDFVGPLYPYPVETPYGNIKNYCNNLKYDSKTYRIIHQTEIGGK